MSDNEEDEDEVVFDGGYYSVQKQDDEPEPQTKAIGFFKAFCLPGVIPVGQIKNFACFSVFVSFHLHLFFLTRSQLYGYHIFFLILSGNSSNFSSDNI